MQTQTPVTIGEAAKQCGISPESIRHYERIGLLQKPLRGANGYRYYSADSLSTLATIRAWREIGMSLDEIRDLGEATAEGEMQCADVQKKLLTHADDARERIAVLQALEAQLRSMADECSTGTNNCPVVKRMSDHRQAC